MKREIIWVENYESIDGRYTCPSCEKDFSRVSINSELLCPYCGHLHENPDYKKLSENGMLPDGY